MNRTQARVNAMKLAYEWEMGNDGGLDTRAGLLEITEAETDEENTAFMETLFKGVCEHKDEIDAKITASMRGNWKLDRLSKVDLSILRIGLYELLWEKTPAGIVISSCVEMAHTYSTEQIYTFINGLLASVARESKAEE